MTSRRLVGDPVDVVTGANTDVAVDFRLHGPLPLRWRRYYNSARNTVHCPLGWGHTHDFNRTLTYDLEGMRYTDPLGVDVAFPPLEVGERAANAGFLLRRANSESYELFQAGEPTQDFEFSGSIDTAPVQRLRQGKAQIEFRYAVDGHLRQIVDSLRQSISVEWDRLGRILGLFVMNPSDSGQKRRALMVYEYDQSGNLRSARDMYEATLRFRWDGNNRMTCRTDRRGYSFLFTYDEEGRCVHSRGEDGLFEVALDYQPLLNKTIVRRGDGGKWTYTYNATGTVTKIVDPYGAATSFTLDETGRVNAEIDPNGNVTKLLYNSMGGHYARLDPLGYLLPTYEEDPNPPDPLAYKLPETPLEWEHGHLLRGRDFEGSIAEDTLLQEFPIAVREAFLGLTPGDGASGSALDRQPPKTDEQGRPLEQGSPRRMQRWKYDSNGNLAEHHDPDGAVYRYVYKSWNALHQEIDPLGNTTVYEHSSQGLVNSVRDPGGTLTEYGYDLKDRISEVRHDGRVRERYFYDAAGNMVEKTDGQGQSLVTWKIGIATLDVSRTLSSGEVHSFEYDEKGRITSAATPNGITAFAFNKTGQLTADQRDGLGVVHEFDSGQLSAIIYFDKFRVCYTSEDNGDLTIVDPTGMKHRFVAGESGLVARRFGSGALELCWYDDEGRCRGKALANNRHHRAPWIRTFSYSPAGDLLGSRDTLHGTVRYRYDAAHNLAEEILPDESRRAFRYDNAGNLLLQPGLSEVHVDTGNFLRSVSGGSFSYNDRDHLSERQGANGVTRYEYNSLDMLVRCEVDRESWTASYDPLGRRTRKTWRGQTTEFYWDDFRLAAERRHDGSVRIYIYEDHIALVPFLFVEYAGLGAGPASGKRYYIFTNQIGAPVRVEDDEGRACWSARLDPYGRAHVSPESSLEMPLRFPGHYHDSETGLHYNRFRYFSPELGRYLQRDPAGLEGGVNVYSYNANPLTESDIDGLARSGPAKPKPTSSRAGKEKEGTPTGAEASCPLVAPKPEGNKGSEPLTREEGQKILDALHNNADGRPNGSTTSLTEHASGALSVTTSHPTRVVPPAQRKAIEEMQKPGGALEGRNVIVPDDRSKPDTYIPKDNRDLPGSDAGNHSEARGAQAGNVYGDPATRQWSSSGANHGGAACDDCEPMQNKNGIKNETGFQSQGGRYDRGGTDPSVNGG